MQSLAIGTEATLHAASADSYGECGRLTDADRAAIVRHLCALSGHDLEMRFGAALTASAIERNVERIDFDRDIVLASFGVAGTLQGLAQVMRLPGVDSVAEVAFSVHPSMRRQGVGTRLMQVVLHAARAHGIVRLVAQVCPRNFPMLTILRRAGMCFVREDGEMIGTLNVARAPHAYPMQPCAWLRKEPATKSATIGSPPWFLRQSVGAQEREGLCTHRCGPFQ